MTSLSLSPVPSRSTMRTTSRTKSRQSEDQHASRPSSLFEEEDIVSALAGDPTLPNFTGTFSAARYGSSSGREWTGDQVDQPPDRMSPAAMEEAIQAQANEITRGPSHIGNSAVPSPSSSYKPNLYLAGTIVGFTGWLFGFDTGSIGPVTEMPHFPSLDAGLQGFVVAVMLLTALLASPVAGPLTDKFSHCYIVSAGCAIYALGSALCVASSGSGLALFLVGRALAGVGEGLFLSPASVWLVEAAPKERRGRMGSLIQLCIISGVTGGYFVCYGSVNIDSVWQWRLPYLCQVFVASTLSILVLTPLVPQSPRWLLLRSKTPHLALPIIEAFAISKVSAEIEKTELLMRTDQERAEIDQALAAGGRGWVSRLGLGGISECFETRGHRRSKSTLGIALLGIQQLGGIDAVLFYAPVIFSSAGLSSKQGSFLASGLTGIVGLVTTIPCQLWMMDRLGRRPATMVGGIIMGACMITIGGIYASGAGSYSRGAQWTVIGLIYVFVAGFQTTWSLVLKCYVAEIQPNSTRASASSLAQCCNWVVNIVIALSTPAFLKKSPSGPYFLYGTFCLIGAVIGFVMPETKGLSMQEVDEAWERKAERVHEVVGGLRHWVRKEARRAETDAFELGVRREQ